MSALIIREAELPDGRIADVQIENGYVSAIDAHLATQGDVRVVSASGSALLPGLHDHHIHLFALAAAKSSVACGPPEIVDRAGLMRALADAPRSAGSIRGVAYHESVAGDLDRHDLDALSPPDIPVRIQHRSGALWILNSAAIERFDIARDPLPAGVERTASGELTGRIYYEDAWLRERMGAASIPDLAQVGRELAACGVTSVMDATPDKGPADIAALELAITRAEFPQRVTAMGNLGLESTSALRIEIGPVKIMLREAAPPDFDELVATIAQAHSAGRCVAFHCVTRAELVMACSALSQARPLLGDRIEHASIAPPDLVAWLAEMNVWVVTQPGFVFERGSVYLREVDASDHPWLYRGRGFIDAGVSLGAGTDAPYGSCDPWVAIRAAVSRTTNAGEVLGKLEALSPERALALFTTPIASPGGASTRIEVGSEADLCLLDLPWHAFRSKLAREHVALTICRGEVIWQRGEGRETSP